MDRSRQQLLAPVAALRTWILYLIGAILVVGLAAARWAAARLAEPVGALAQIITSYADGNHDVRYCGERRDEIGAAGKAFNYLLERLAQANRERDDAEKAARQSERLAALGQLAAGIGHEINNPLMNIMSLSTLIEQSLPSDADQARSDLRAIHKEGRRCARIVQGILNFGRETQTHYKRFDFAELIDETIALCRHRLDASAIRLQHDVSSPQMIEGDAGQLQQVIVNVLLNAIQASHVGGEIEIKAHSRDGMLSLTIADQGEGIRPEDLSQVFNPFFTTKPEGSGTGLGLSVSYGIIQSHGGSIGIENRAQGGVSVSIVLPISRHPARANRVAELEHA